MDSFSLFFEKRQRNPLRKRDLADRESNIDYINRQPELPDEDLEKIRKMEEFKVDPDKIEHFKNAKKIEFRKSLENSYLKPKIDTPVLLFNHGGFKVFKDKYATEDFSKKSKFLENIKRLINKFNSEYKGILPNRKPKIIITDTDVNPHTKGVNITGTNDNPSGIYWNKMIFLDQEDIDYQVFVHEYAHLIADTVNTQVQHIIQDGYKKMLNAYFRTNTRKKNLEGIENEIHRRKIAKKMGLPTEYSATNFDEWFAELMAHWHNLPKDVNSYKFKQVLKKVLTRL